MRVKTKHFYEFGGFRIDRNDRLLLRGSEVIPLTPKALDLLLTLVENNGHVLSKDELMREVWPDSFVEEANLSHHIFTLRKALGEDKNGAKFIETLPRRGYRFVASVTEIDDASNDLVLTEHTRSHIVVEEVQDASLAGQPFEVEQARAVKALGSNAPTESRSNRKPTLLIGVAVAMFVTLSVVIYFWVTGKPKPDRSTPVVKSIAVLPFKPLGTDIRNESLELGMAETLINKLSGIKQLIVRPISAIRKYTGLEQDVMVAGRELEVDYVLEGNLQMVGEKTRATVRLLNVKDGSAIWTNSCDQACSSIFELQDAVAHQIAGSLTLQLNGDERKQLAKHYTENVEAYQLYVKGRFFWNKFTDEALTKSVDYFQQAIDKDPSYALAYAGLSESYNVLGSNGPMASRDALPKVKYAAEKAVELDDNLAEAHLSLGAYKLFYAWDWIGAERAFKRAMELDPGYAEPHELYGYLLRIMGRFDEALVEIRTAQKLNPVSLLMSGDSGETQRLARRYDQAIDEIHKTLEMNPDFADAHLGLGLNYGLKGMYDQAITEMKTAIRLSGNNTQIIGRLGYVYALAGNRAEAQKIINQLQAASKKRYFPPLEIAMIYSTLGENDRAFTWLEKALDDHSSWLIELKVEPGWDKIRTDPRFGKLVSRVGLPE